MKEIKTLKCMVCGSKINLIHICAGICMCQKCKEQSDYICELMC
jgi:hypothetical protein